MKEERGRKGNGKCRVHWMEPMASWISLITGSIFAIGDGFKKRDATL